MTIFPSEILSLLCPNGLTSALLKVLLPMHVEPDVAIRANNGSGLALFLGSYFKVSSYPSEKADFGVTKCWLINGLSYFLTLEWTR